MSLKKLIWLTIIAFFIWLIPFIIGLSLTTDINHSTTSTVLNNKEISHSVVNDIFNAYSKNNRTEAFRLIFLNNLKVVIFNIVGGVLLGLGTFINLLQNGFYAANIFSIVHNNGLSWGKIVTFTAPHSIEMLGIWLSGGLGFYIAKAILDFIRNNKYPTDIFYKRIGLGFLVCTLIVLIAAYIEAFISVPINN